MDVLCLTALRDCPDRLDEAACWFHEKWGIPAEVYRDSIRQGIRQKAGIPQWYIVQKEEGEIVAGVGLIDHDYHSRRDLTPNVCALYVEEHYRRRGIARLLLDHVKKEAAEMGTGTLYLVTDHTAFYETCGWHFMTMAEDEEGNPIRLYAAQTGE